MEEDGAGQRYPKGRWTLEETITFVNALEREFGPGLAYEARGTTDSFVNIETYMRGQGIMNLSASTCKTKYTKMRNAFNKIQEWSQRSNLAYSSLTNAERTKFRLPSMYIEVLDLMRALVGKYQVELVALMAETQRDTQSEKYNADFVTVSSPGCEKAADPLQRGSEEEETESLFSKSKHEENIQLEIIRTPTAEEIVAVTHGNTESPKKKNSGPKSIQEERESDENERPDAQRLHDTREGILGLRNVAVTTRPTTGCVLSPKNPIQEEEPESERLPHKKQKVDNVAGVLPHARLVGRSIKKQNSRTRRVKKDAKPIKPSGRKSVPSSVAEIENGIESGGHKPEKRSKKGQPVLPSNTEDRHPTAIPSVPENEETVSISEITEELKRLRTRHREMMNQSVAQQQIRLEKLVCIVNTSSGVLGRSSVLTGL